jgi:hypothetical protein
LPSVEQAGHDESVAPVVALAAQDDDAFPPRRAEDLCKPRRHALSRPLHERLRRDAGFRDGAAVERLHLYAGDDFHHRRTTWSLGMVMSDTDGVMARWRLHVATPVEAPVG